MSRGRKPIFDRPMTPAERQQRSRKRRRAENPRGAENPADSADFAGFGVDDQFPKFNWDEYYAARAAAGGAEIVVDDDDDDC